MFIYKVLEYIGYGPKAHFFFNRLSPGGFFVATQDAGFTKGVGKTKTFTIFDKIKQKYGANPAAEEYRDARRNIICLDMLARIFRLTDTTTNPGNYGFTQVSGDERRKWKIIDFRFPDQPEFYLNRNILQGFEEGNTEFCYKVYPFIEYVLQNREFRREKYTAANQIVHELLEGRACKRGKKMSLIVAMQHAYQETTDYFQQYGRELEVTDFNDFELYYKAITSNLEILFVGIEQTYKQLEIGSEQRVREENPAPPTEEAHHQ